MWLSSAPSRSIEALYQPAGTDHPLPQSCAVRIDGFFIAAGRVVDFLVFLIVEEHSVNPAHLYLWDSATPDVAERVVQRRSVASGEYFVDKRDVVSGREDQRKLILGGGKNVVDAVERRVNDLDVLHR